MLTIDRLKPGKYRLTNDKGESFTVTAVELLEIDAYIQIDREGTVHETAKNDIERDASLELKAYQS